MTIARFDEEVASAADPPFTPVHFKPSMQVDLESGRPIEVQGIVGGVVKRGRTAGVSSPRYVFPLRAEQFLLLFAA